MRRIAPALVLLMSVLTLPVVAADSRPDSAHVRSYDAVIEPDLDTRTIKGHVTVRVIPQHRAKSVTFDCGDLVIDSVTDRSGRLPFYIENHRVSVTLRDAAGTHETLTLTFRYHGAPIRGVRFLPEQQQVFTVFSTSQWLVCLDSPNERATIRLTVVAPSSWTVVANGRETRRQPLPDGRTSHEFRDDRPVPSYTFGFAAGRFDVLAGHHKQVGLSYVTSGLSSDEVHRVFDDTPDMLTFFESTAGLPYPEPIYAQVLTGGAGLDGQEMSGFSTLTDAHARSMLANSHAVTLSAHEFAHQWWGNTVTCRDWTDFWLNEGFATFMAAAYVEHRFGRAEYDRLIADYRMSYERIRQSGHDKSLVFPDWRQPTADDRALVYRKGAYVLHLLRQELGDTAFWSGIRAYTRSFGGRSVDTGDFQRAMERSTGGSLADFFDKWVYLRTP
jgi:aminopeptidase N